MSKHNDNKPPMLKSVQDAKDIISLVLRALIILFLFWLVHTSFSFLNPTLQDSKEPQLSTNPKSTTTPSHSFASASLDGKSKGFVSERPTEHPQKRQERLSERQER